jgi:hypothetical protein
MAEQKSAQARLPQPRPQESADVEGVSFAGSTFGSNGFRHTDGSTSGSALRTRKAG